jgi:hypothetical protein
MHGERKYNGFPNLNDASLFVTGQCAKFMSISMKL